MSDLLMVVTWGKPPHESAIAAYHAKTLALLRHPLPYDDRGEALKPLRLNTTDARRQWIAFSDEVDAAALKPGLRLHEISGFASKITEHAARIAAVLAVYDEPAVQRLDTHHLKRGIELANYYARGSANKKWLPGPDSNQRPSG
jgi:hypothetical protein